MKKVVGVTQFPKNREAQSPMAFMLFGLGTVFLNSECP